MGQEQIYSTLACIVIKLGSDVNPVYELSHWVTGSTNGSSIELQSQITRF